MQCETVCGFYFRDVFVAHSILGVFRSSIELKNNPMNTLKKNSWIRMCNGRNRIDRSNGVYAHVHLTNQLWQSSG